MEDPAQLLVGFGKWDGMEVAVILYIDPVLDEWMVWGTDPNTFEMQLLKEVPLDLYRQYLPYQLPLLVGFRKNKEFVNRMHSNQNGTVPIIVQMLRDSGYTVLPHKYPDDVTVKELDTAMRERPDLYQRREMKEE